MHLFLQIPRVAEAFRLCVEAHGNQKYGDLPYFTHPLEVAEALTNPTEDTLVATLLHDVVEDTNIDVNMLREQFGNNVAFIVALLTKDSTLSYEKNILRIIRSGSMEACKVKLADNLVNLRNDKSHMSAARQCKLNLRYAASFAVLSAVIEESTPDEYRALLLEQYSIER